MNFHFESGRKKGAAPEPNKYRFQAWNPAVNVQNWHPEWTQIAESRLYSRKPVSRSPMLRTRILHPRWRSSKTQPAPGPGAEKSQGTISMDAKTATQQDEQPAPCLHPLGRPVQIVPASLICPYR